MLPVFVFESFEFEIPKGSIIQVHYFVSFLLHYRKNVVTNINETIPFSSMGRGSSVGIANRYGIDGPGIESRWGPNIPHPSIPALGPTHPPIQWAPSLSGW